MGQLLLSAAMVEGGPAVGGASFVIAVDDPDAPAGRREIARSAHAEPSFTLPAGTYYVTARLGDAEARQRVAVGPGESVQRTLALGLASIHVSATLEGGAAAEGPILHRVLVLDGDQREVARSTANPSTFTLAGGRYRVETHLGNANVKATTDIAVHAGKDGRLDQVLPAARVTIRPVDAGTARPAGTTAGAWEVRDAKGEIVWRARESLAATALLAPGRYTARSETADRLIETAFDVKSGEQRTVDLTPR
jgi:Ca-activated chloride channel family protein